MSRILPNWIESYLEYNKDTESAAVFHKWVAISMIAAVLRKKVKLTLGRMKIFPNMYIVLVAEPGTARKTTAIDFGKELLEDIPDIYTSADSITREALIEDLEKSACEEILKDGTSFRHSSMSIISGEFESFLGQKTENTKMLVLLTDLFDCKEKPWSYRTKGKGTNMIPSVFINLLGATTPESLASCLPSSAIGGGLTSRILFIWAGKKDKKIPVPTYDESTAALREKLQKDLFRISKIQGVYEFTKEAETYWIDWYMEYEEHDPRRIAQDKAFDGWYSRKPLYIQKLAMVLAASESDELLIHKHHVSSAIADVESVETYMARVFRAVGRSSITADVDMVMEIVKERGFISEKDLMAMVWRDIDKMKFDNVINTALATGRIKREYVMKIEGKLLKGIWYVIS
jgi:hypothetical protein